MLLRTPLDFGAAIRDRRRRLQLGQADLAERVGVSRKWVIDVEKGKARAEIGLILRTLNALDLRLSIDTGLISGFHDAGFPDVSAPDIDSVLERARNRLP